MNLEILNSFYPKICKNLCYIHETVGSRKNEGNNSNFPDLLISGSVGAANTSESIRTSDKKSVDSGAREMVVIKINIPNVCESSGTNGDSKVRGQSRGEKRWRARCRFPLVCSITIYKADIFPNKSFFSNLLHRTTDKLDVDSSCRGTGGSRTDTLSETDAVFCCAVVRIFIRPPVYLWTIACVRHCADSRNDLRPFFDYAASLRIHNRRYM